MPLGDSITRGQVPDVSSSLWEGYRAPLYTALTAAGIAFDFVGSQSAGDTLPDKDHEGHGGDAITVINAAVAGYLSANPPDIVVLIAGTNDINNGDSGATTAARMATLLATIYSARPWARVVVAVPPLMTVYPSEYAAYAAALPGVVAARVAGGQWAVLVETDAVVTADTVGHPTLAGYSTLAELLLPAVRLAIRDIEGDRGDVSDYLLFGDPDLPFGSMDRLFGTLRGTLRAAYPAHEVIVGGVGLRIAQGGYTRRMQQQYAAKLSTAQLSDSDRLGDQTVLIDGWQGGEGTLRHNFSAPSRYRAGSGIDIHSESGAVGLGPYMSAIAGVTSLAVNEITALCPGFGYLMIGTGTGKVYAWDGATLTLAYDTTKAGGIRSMVFWDGQFYVGTGSDGVVYRWTGASITTTWASNFTVGPTGGGPTVTGVYGLQPHVQAGVLNCFYAASQSGAGALTGQIANTGGTTVAADGFKMFDRDVSLLTTYQGKLIAVSYNATDKHWSLYEGDNDATINWTFLGRTEGGYVTCATVLDDVLYLGDAVQGKIWRWDGNDLTLYHQLGSDINPYTPQIKGLATWRGGLWVGIADEDGTMALLRDNGSEDWSRPVSGLLGTSPGVLRVWDDKLHFATAATGAARVYKTDGTFIGTGNVESALIDARLAGTGKLWRSITVSHTPLAATQSVEVQYKLEDAGSWVSLGTSDTDAATSGTFEFPTPISADLIAIKTILTGTAGSSTPLKVYSISARYIPAPGVKYEWELTLRLEGTAAEPLILADGTLETRTGEELSAEVWALVAANTDVNLVDIDREERTVRIADYSEGLSSIRPNKAPLDTSWQLQGSLKLVEV